LAAFGQIFIVYANDLLAFINQPDFITSGRWNIQLTLGSIVVWAVTLVPTMICFCEFLDFFWIDLSNILQLDSLIISLDAFYNIFVRLFQVPIYSIFNFTLPTIEPVIIEWCIFVVATGDFIEDAIWILIESFFNVITNLINNPNLTIPQPVKNLFNVKYMLIVTEPLCIAGSLLNMTLEAVTHYGDIAAPDRSGIAYFQFSYLFDRLALSTDAFADLYIITGPEVICGVRESARTVIVLLKIIFEFIPGILFFFFLPTCCQIPFIYILDYWEEIPLKEIHFAVPQAHKFAKCVGDQIGQLNMPFGGAVQYFLNVVFDLFDIAAGFLASTANLFFVFDGARFIYADISFDPITIDLPIF